MRLFRTWWMAFALGVSLQGNVQAQTPAAKPAAVPDARIASQLKALDYQYEVDEDGDYKLVFDVDAQGKRTQLVLVRSAVEDYAGFKVREIWSVGYKAGKEGFPGAVANRLLEASMDSKMGGWGKQGDTALFIVRIAADAGKDALDAALIAALNSADDMEAELTPGKDDH